MQRGCDIPPWSTQIPTCQRHIYRLIKILTGFLQKGILSVFREQGRVKAVHKTLVHIEHILVIAVALKACFDSLNAFQGSTYTSIGPQ